MMEGGVYGPGLRSRAVCAFRPPRVVFVFRGPCVFKRKILSKQAEIMDIDKDKTPGGSIKRKT
jgi:hypothetical protein